MSQVVDDGVAFERRTWGSDDLLIEDDELLTAAGEPHMGAMIALVPTAEDAERLAVDGGEDADQLHVTLFYLGKAANFDQDARAQVVDRIHYQTRELPVLTVDAFAVSMFNPEGLEPCVALQLSGDGLEEFHEAAHDAVATLDDDTQDVLPEQHPVWTPHITLAYTDDADLSYFTDRTGPVTFDRVRIAFGGDEFDIPLREDALELPGAEVAAGFKADQPRDSNGRWTSSGVGSASSLIDAYAAGYTVDDEFSGGQVADSVDLLTLSDGRRAVRKKLSNFYGMTPQTQIDREVLAAKVANTIGIDDVSAQSVSDNEVLLSFIDGKTGIRAAYDNVKITEQLELPGAREVGLLDWLIGNMDRKSSNWIVTPDRRVVPIDHGHAWDSTGTNSPFAKQYITGYESQSGELAQPTATEYTSAELAALRARLNITRDEFTQAGRTREFDEMMQRLTELEAVAT